jgi:hypothetical protein
MLFPMPNQTWFGLPAGEAKKDSFMVSKKLVWFGYSNARVVKV